jgi:hypothetical protein
MTSLYNDFPVGKARTQPSVHQSTENCECPNEQNCKSISIQAGLLFELLVSNSLVI